MKMMIISRLENGKIQIIRKGNTMKRFLALFVICCMLMTTLASCDLLDKILGRKCTEHVDADFDYICDNCGAELQEPEPPVCEEHKDDDGNEKCDVCGADVPKPEPPVCEEHKDDDGNEKCDVCGADVPKPEPPVCEEHKDEDGDYKCDECGEELERPEPPAHIEHVDTDGNYVCDVCGTILERPPHTEHVDADGDYKCDECKYVMFEEVEYSLNISDLETGTRANDEINGKFTILSGSEIRNRTKSFEGVEYSKSVKIGNAATKIKVSVPGAGKLYFLIQNGSSGASTQFVTVTAPDGTVHDIEFDGTNNGSPVVKIELDVTQGDWIISRGKNGGTQDVFYLHLSCVVAVSPESGFELVTPGTTDFLAGDEFSTESVRLNAVFENGKTDPLDLSKVTIDSSAVDMSKAGVYDIIISYKDYEPVKYQISVFAPESIKLGLDAIEKLAQNSSAGNGVYFNHSFKEVYGIGDELDTKGLSVIVVAKCGEKSLEFKVDDYTLTGFDSASAGKKTLTISANGVSANVDVYVVDAAIAEGNQVKVDKAYTGAIGAVVDGYNMFTTIQQALDYLARVDAAEKKLLVIGEGLFTEKLEITIPNLTVRGAGADKTIIEWDSLYGLVDAGGFTHTTDSTQTVAVREQAVNCVIEGVTISNYWNTQERLDEAGLAIERNLALLVQADRFIMKNSALLAIQDTLELFTGRQYFENVFISGYTDFIFGTNNTTYFKNCTIHTIDTSKDNAGTAGYLTAFKGSNKGAADAIVYGAIFDGCKFTADEGVMPGCTAIGRTWGAYAAVAIINSELGGHISVDGYDSANNKNKRYISMNGVHPTDETVQFVEYNNTGDGAVTEAVAGMRLLTAEEAALYADFATIYGTTNGKVSYLDPWDPMSTDVVVDDRTYYYFNGQTGTTGTSYTYDQDIPKGSTGTFGDIAIDATLGKVTARASDTQMNEGAKLTFSVEAGTLVTVVSHPGYGYYKINGVAHNANNTFSMYFAEATEVVIQMTGTAYLYQIIINPDEEAPEAPTLEEIKVSGATLNFTVGTEFTTEGMAVKAIYSDNSVREVSDYTLDSSAINVNAEGEYEVVITYGGKSVTLKVTYEDPNAGPEITKDTVLDFTTVDGLETVQNNPKVTINGSVRHNGGEIQIAGTISFKVKAGTVVSVIPYANSSYASYKLYAEGEESTNVYNAMHSVMFFEDCTVIYEGLDDNYLCSISIECPLGEGKYVFGGSSEEGDITGILESIPGMSVTGTCKTHSGGAQLGADSQITFNVSALATVTIQGFDTSYGQLLVLVNGEPVEMDEKAQYVFTALSASTIIIEAVNVGTDEAPAWNKSYITYIDVDLPTFVEEDLTVSFGSAGNYKDCGIDLSGITIGDNGGSNSQVKNGSFSFAVREGAKVTVHGYSGYTSYNLGDGDVVYESITDEYFTYEALNDCVITISHTSGNNYFYSIEVKYPVEVKPESVSLTFGSAGNYHESVPAAIDLSNITIGDNGGTNSQVKEGTITITLLAGAKLTINGYSGYTDYTLSDGTAEYVINKDSADHTAHVYTAEADVTVTITPNSGNNYFYGIDITY